MSQTEQLTAPQAAFDELSNKDRRFVEAYVADPKRNGTRAAISAGYESGKDGASAAVAASRLLRKDKIIKAISELEEKLRSEDSLLPRLVAMLSAITFTDLRDVMRWDSKGNISLIPSNELSPAASAALASVQSIQEEKQGRLPGLDDEPEAAANVIRKNVKLHEKLGAAKLLIQVLGLGSPERLELSGDLFARLETARQRGNDARD